MGFALSTLAGFIAGALGTLTVAYSQREGYLFTESRHLPLEHKTVPSDLLRYVRPGTSVANMREMLGAPLAETEQTYRYKFDNLYLEVESEDGITIDSMTLVLPSVKESDDFPIPPLERHSEPDYVLGELRLGEKVIRIFPNMDSTWRLLGALLAEKHEERSTGRKYLDMTEFRTWKEQANKPESEPDDSTERQPAMAT